MRFPNPNLKPHGRFAPSLQVADSYVGATSGPRLGPGGILVGLLSSATPGRPIRRSRGVTPSSCCVYLLFTLYMYARVCLYRACPSVGFASLVVLPPAVVL